jgi:hypothetical protein
MKYHVRKVLSKVLLPPRLQVQNKMKNGSGIERKARLFGEQEQQNKLTQERSF